MFKLHRVTNYLFPMESVVRHSSVTTSSNPGGPPSFHPSPGVLHHTAKVLGCACARILLENQRIHDHSVVERLCFSHALPLKWANIALTLLLLHIRSYWDWEGCIYNHPHNHSHSELEGFRQSTPTLWRSFGSFQNCPLLSSDSRWILDLSR
jgi:hypothetical protein